MLKPLQIVGMVLAGGFSSRLGQDKSQLEWHNVPQWQYLAILLKHLEIPVVISCRQDQLAAFAPWETLPDRFDAIGPMGGILSAMESFPGCAVLVVACDMPMVNSNTLQFLLEQRKSTVFCTAYSQPENPAAPEPLLAIWEPLSVEILQSAQVNGMYSLRDTLKNTKNYKLIPAKYAAELINVNTKEDLMRVKEMLSKK